ncbi:unnamed protein product [Protopolystoma xenopodis]|uniref:Uncharacterized protein n=1 Tax=Protopolystoma xenopodis TaxID=117903 RepID=A0A448WFT7_9PLAT|nr:unnamed protein product [Protopolystoma xenopodis]
MSTAGCSSVILKLSSNLFMYALAESGESGDPIRSPNICSYMFPLNVKLVVFTVKLISLVKDFLPIRCDSRISSSRSRISSRDVSAFYLPRPLSFYRLIRLGPPISDTFIVLWIHSLPFWLIDFIRF